MRAALLVAGAVFKESIRDRVPYSMVVFAVLMMAASYLISQMTAGQDLKIIKDLGLASLSIFGLLIAVFIGIGLVSKEVEKKSVYSLLAKPVSRTQFILGKYLGLVLTLMVNLGVMTVAFYAVLFYVDATASASARGSWAAPPRRSAAAHRDRADRRRTGDRHGPGVVLLHLLESAALGAAHAGLVGGRSLQRRSAAVRDRDGRAGRGLDRAGRCTTYCRTLRRSTSSRGRLRRAGRRRHAAYTLAYAVSTSVCC